jgi:hypothetical protein
MVYFYTRHDICDDDNDDATGYSVHSPQHTLIKDDPGTTFQIYEIYEIYKLCDTSERERVAP